MKYTIKKIQDSMVFGEEQAIELAKKQLKGTDYFCALYGKKENGKKEFFIPVLMDEETLKETKKDLLKRDPEGMVYAVYHSHLDDVPFYEIEYDKGEAYVDIPEEEIKEFIKNKLIEIANNPRLIDKYRHGLEDLLEKDLQEYANKLFFEEGRGEIVEDSKKVVELHYPKLTVSIWKKYHEATEIEPEEYDYIEEDIEYDYSVPEDEIKERLFDFMWDDKEYEELEKPEIEEKIENEFDELIEKYNDKLLEYYKEDAREEAEGEE